MTQSTSGKVQLKPRARLISLIGEELISDEPVALVELVKNSYDADATRVEVRFEGADPNHPQNIIVSDDGIGMNLETVLGAWLEPGTSSKRKTTISPAGRLYQGAKGIGRFAAARLAKRLMLETKSKDSPDEVLVVLDWGQFDEDSYLEDIDVEYETFASTRSQGTTLTLQDVRRSWSDDDYEELYDRLTRLISPFDEVVDFTIELVIPERAHLSGNVTPHKLIERPVYYLTGELDKDGYFTGWFNHNGKTKIVWGDNSKLNHDDIKAVADTQFRPRLKRGNADESPECGKFEVEIRVWDRDRDGLNELMNIYELGLRQTRRIINRYSGVSIYRDGFRVYPYGQDGNDWLQLDNRSRQVPARHLANNQIIASIKISREDNPELMDRSNREGMIINSAHRSLENWFIEILSIIEEERYKLRPRKTTLKPEGTPMFEVFDLSATVKSAKERFGDDDPFVFELSQTADEVSEGVERVQELFSRLLLSSGLGQMVDIVIHEIGRPLGSINRRIRMIENAVEDDCDETGKIKNNLDSIKGSLTDLANLRERLDPHTPAKRGRAETFDVLEEIQDNFELYSYLIESQKIKFNIESNVDVLTVHMARSTLSQIMANLIDNSIFWLIRTNGTGGGGNIFVKVQETEGGFKIEISDDGPGVSKEDQIDIFEPYFSRKPGGSGLGLYIARLVIEPYGRLVYREDCELSGACFELNFEKSVGR